MKIAMIGAGYVGLVSGACFSEFGHHVTCIDQDELKISRLRRNEIPIYEPGLDALVARNAAAGRLKFERDLSATVADADLVFIAVGTPSRRGDGHADLTFVRDAARQIAQALHGYTAIVTKSTVPVGTGREVADIIRATNPKADFDVVSNPEFLREGSAIDDFMRPNRVVIGAETERAREKMRELYRPLFLIETPILFTGLETAELIKYAANGFLAMKISFINQIADLCEKVGADVHDVARGVGLDGRIGQKFLHPGPGYGGSCFPKDTRALVEIARQANAPVSLIEATAEYNETRKLQMAERVLAALGGAPDGKVVALLGLTFKPNTDDMREAPSLAIAPALIKVGVDGQGARSGRHGGSQEADAGRFLLRRSLRGDDRRGRGGVPNRVEFLPRARSAPDESRPAAADHRRSAQHLPAVRDAGRRIPVFQHRARLVSHAGRAPTSETSEVDVCATISLESGDITAPTEHSSAKKVSTAFTAWEYSHSSSQLLPILRYRSPIPRDFVSGIRPHEKDHQRRRDQQPGGRRQPELPRTVAVKGCAGEIGEQRGENRHSGPGPAAIDLLDGEIGLFRHRHLRRQFHQMSGARSQCQGGEDDSQEMARPHGHPRRR